MPLGGDAGREDSEHLALLEARLEDRWSRLRVRAKALTEPDLIALCRNELAASQTAVRREDDLGTRRR
jgi:hypothetical protein